MIQSICGYCGNSITTEECDHIEFLGSAYDRQCKWLLHNDCAAELDNLFPDLNARSLFLYTNLNYHRLNDYLVRAIGYANDLEKAKRERNIPKVFQLIDKLFLNVATELFFESSATVKTLRSCGVDVSKNK
jgi:hypothetical protein